jgi:hypothetical protein
VKKTFGSNFVSVRGWPELVHSGLEGTRAQKH